LQLLVWNYSLITSIEKESLEILILDCWVGRREVEMLIYANILKSDTRVIGLEIRINRQ